MKKINYLVLILFVLIAQIAAAEDQSSGETALTLEESIRIALTENPSLQAVRHRVSVARAKVTEAGTYYLPELKLLSGYGYMNDLPKVELAAGALGSSPLSLSIGDQQVGGVRFYLQQPIFTGGKISALNDQAENNLELHEFSYIRSEQNLIFQVTAAYLNILKAGREREVAQAAVKQLIAHLETVRNLYQAGNVSRLDLLRTEVQLAGARQMLNRSDHGVELAKSAFNILLSREMETPLKVEDILQYIPRELVLRESIDAALENRPELRIMESQKEIVRAARAAARTEYWPQIGAMAAYNYDWGDGDLLDWEGDWGMAALTVNMDIWSWGRTEAKEEQALYLLAEIQEKERQLRDGIGLEVKQAFLETTQARENITVSEKALSTAEESYESSRVGYRNGRINNVEVLASQLALTEAGNNYLQSLYDYQLARAQLEKAIGRITTK